MEYLVIDLKRRRKSTQYGGDDFTNYTRIATVGDDHHKLVAAEAAYLYFIAAFFSDFDKTLADFDKQLISGRMTERVIHVFEAIEVKQRHGRLSMSTITS